MNGIKMVHPNTIDFSKITSVYSGKAGVCCCGCAGGHSTNKGTITKTINKFKTQNEIEEYREYNKTKFVSVTINKRWYIAYFNTSIK